jgi:hypothetical protein
MIPVRELIHVLAARWTPRLLPTSLGSIVTQIHILQKVHPLQMTSFLLCSLDGGLEFIRKSQSTGVELGTI